MEIFAKNPVGDEPWDVVIVGSGPAGLTASIYTTRGAASTLLIAGSNWGGQLMLTTDVDNFPGFPEGIQGPELMGRMRKQAERFGTKILDSDLESVDISNPKKFVLTTSGKSYFARSIIVATGAQTKWLGIPGEDKLRGRGVSSCAPCDAPFFKNKIVAVVGGGDSAMEESLVLTKYASQVILIHRKNEFKASKAMQVRVFDEVKKGKIKIVWDTEVLEFVGDSKLEKIKLKNVSSSEFSEMNVDGAFVAIGHEPSTKAFVGKIDLDQKGYVLKNPSGESFTTSTNVPGIFVAGDVHDHHYKQAITASGYGCTAAIDALNYLDKDTQSW